MDFKKGFAGRRDQFGDEGARVYRVSFGVIDTLLRPDMSLQIVNHSPDGFEWGYNGSGPAQLSLAILLDVFRDEHLALKNYQSFKEDKISRLSETWDMSVEEIEKWMKERGIPTIGWLLSQEFMMGRLLSQSKSGYLEKNPGHRVYFNANIFAESEHQNGKVWYGDIDLEEDEDKLKEIAEKTKSSLYLVREMDGRFGREESCDYERVAVWKS